jgi:broad specificity phosphatase PhoE
MKPLPTIKIVRHAESILNVGMVKHQDQPNHTITITPDGHDQAYKAGGRLGANFINNSLIYCSPYTRTRQTLEGILDGSLGVGSRKPKIYEDPSLREMDFGYEDPEAQKPVRNKEGYFWYRYNGGESPADCYDRADAFIASMWRQYDRKPQENILIVTHGIMVRCLVMRFLHLTVEQWTAIDNPENCDIVTIREVPPLSDIMGIPPAVQDFRSGKWMVSGLRMR